jgi:hypothetical protein
MSTDTPSQLKQRLINIGGQKLFMGTLMMCSLLAAVGFSLFVFGVGSDLIATTIDRVFIAGIGVVLTTLGGGVAYAILS